MGQLFFTLDDFSKRTGKSIDDLLIMGRYGQIALCVELDAYHSLVNIGTITINDEEFKSLPDQPEETMPDYCIDALFPNWKKAIEESEKLVKEYQEKHLPIYARLPTPKQKRLALPTSVTKISGKWYRKNLKTGKTEREDIPPKWHDPDGYKCFLSGLYQIPMFCIDRKTKTYATNVVFPYDRPELQIQIDKFENRQHPFPVALSGNIEELVIPSQELDKLEQKKGIVPADAIHGTNTDTAETSIPDYVLPTKDEKKAYPELVAEFLDDGLDKVRGERTKFKEQVMGAYEISSSTEDRWFSKAKKEYYKSRK